MTSARPPAPYTIRGIQEMLGLTRGVILGLVDSGFVRPSRGERNEYRFTFRDIVVLRSAVELRAAGIAPRRILAALRTLKARLPDEMPVEGLRISAVGSDITVREGGARWQADSGQLVMDFELAQAEGRSVAFLPLALPARPATSEPQESDGDAATWFARGEALETSDRGAAEAAYRRALALDPAYADAYLNLGALLCEARRCAEAVTLYDRAVRRFPGDALLHFNRAVALEDQGRPTEALAGYDTALRLDDALADAHYNIARLHEQLGDAKQAVRHFSAYRRLQR
ncbi:MAG TPA: tetratricopeptide repeat protein [Caldimonas sp.]|nr:tetratricopeptide repeat protein [Caldimonas sp.]